MSSFFSFRSGRDDPLHLFFHVYTARASIVRCLREFCRRQCRPKDRLRDGGQTPGDRRHGSCR